VQVQMVGEASTTRTECRGVFRPFRTLAPYIHCGRILGSSPEQPGHRIIRAYSHARRHEPDERLRSQLFESDDQKFWEEVIGGKEPEPPANVASVAARMKLSETAVVNYESSS